jgi:hypothetical protein
MLLLRLLPVGLAFGILQVVLRLADDANLAGRLKARDPKAMSDLYDRYGRLAYSLIYRVVRNPSAAEDLLQETFMRAKSWESSAKVPSEPATRMLRSSSA